MRPPVGGCVMGGSGEGPLVRTPLTPCGRLVDLLGNCIAQDNRRRRVLDFTQVANIDKTMTACRHRLVQVTARGLCLEDELG